MSLTFEDAVRYLPYIYLFVISLLTVAFTCYDKAASKKLPGRRVPEATLLFMALIGGSVAMYVTMRTIRHKTQHAKFMIGIPAIILLQLAGAVFFWLYI
ncbi:MAG TPA: DUF1294 domain-containing protein [Clostridiales bacterium]|jgi:uncharacterized membrane protein YsdA (DUF1294 family)|nr:DUF1294 domain-containing protein [Clostridiales bacterium]